MREISLDANVLLGGSATILMLAAGGLTGFFSRDFRSLGAFGSTFVVFFGPALLYFSVREPQRFGWNWKYVVSLACSLAALLLIGMIFHEIFSGTPWFQRH